jgi:broad specificity phosphatase PhoE
MAEFWLIRHGETDWNLEGLYQGQADIPLNATGLRQARETAQKMAEADKPFNALYSSPLQRALQTASETAGLLGLTIQIDERLKEIDQGEWTGKNYRSVVAQFNQADPARADGMLSAAYQRAPGGESVTEVAARVAACADEIASRHPGETVLIFSHGLALATLYCKVRGLGLDEIYHHIPQNGSALVIDWPLSLDTPALRSDT